MSKTKAMATTRKPISVAINISDGSTPGQILLAKLMEQYAMMDSADDTALAALSYAEIMEGLGKNDRNTKWRNAWRYLKEKDGYIVEAEGEGGGGFFTSGFKLTPAGLDAASTDEYKEAMSATTKRPRTNEELHTQIKGRLMNKRGEEIFDLLLERGPLSRTELAGILGISDRGAYFSYALQQLKDLGYAEDVPAAQGRKKKVRLTDKAFVTPPPSSPPATAVTVAKTDSPDPLMKTEDADEE